MPMKRSLFGLGLCLALAGNLARAAEPTGPIYPHGPVPYCPPLPAPHAAPTPSTPTAPTTPGAAPQVEGQQPGAQDVAPPTTDAFAQAPEAGTAATGGFNPNMFGDLLATEICGPVIATFPDGTRRI